MGVLIDELSRVKKKSLFLRWLLSRYLKKRSFVVSKAHLSDILNVQSAALLISLEITFTEVWLKVKYLFLLYHFLSRCQNVVGWHVSRTYTDMFFFIYEAICYQWYLSKIIWMIYIHRYGTTFWCNLQLKQMYQFIKDFINIPDNSLIPLTALHFSCLHFEYKD